MRTSILLGAAALLAVGNAFPFPWGGKPAGPGANLANVVGKEAPVPSGAFESGKPAGFRNSDGGDAMPSGMPEGQDWSMDKRDPNHSPKPTATVTRPLQGYGPGAPATTIYRVETLYGRNAKQTPAPLEEEELNKREPKKTTTSVVHPFGGEQTWNKKKTLT